MTLTRMHQIRIFLMAFTLACLLVGITFQILTLRNMREIHRLRRETQALEDARISACEAIQSPSKMVDCLLEPKRRTP